MPQLTSLHLLRLVGLLLLLVHLQHLNDFRQLLDVDLVVVTLVANPLFSVFTALPLVLDRFAQFHRVSPQEDTRVGLGGSFGIIDTRVLLHLGYCRHKAGYETKTGVPITGHLLNVQLRLDLLVQTRIRQEDMPWPGMMHWLHVNRDGRRIWLNASYVVVLVLKLEVPRVNHHLWTIKALILHHLLLVLLVLVLHLIVIDGGASLMLWPGLTEVRLPAISYRALACRGTLDVMEAAFVLLVSAVVASGAHSAAFGSCITRSLARASRSIADLTV